MKRTITLLAAALLTLGATAQTVNRPSDEMMRQFRQTVQKRDISKRYLESALPQKPAPKGEAKYTSGMLQDNFWFPGE